MVGVTVECVTVGTRVLRTRVRTLERTMWYVRTYVRTYLVLIWHNVMSHVRTDVRTYTCTMVPRYTCTVHVYKYTYHMVRTYMCTTGTRTRVPMVPITRIRTYL